MAALFFGDGKPTPEKQVLRWCLETFLPQTIGIRAGSHWWYYPTQEKAGCTKNHHQNFDIITMVHTLHCQPSGGSSILLQSTVTTFLSHRLRPCNLSLVRSTISGHNASHHPVKLNRRDKLGYCNQPLHLNNIQNMVSLFLKRLARLTSL